MDNAPDRLAGAYASSAFDGGIALYGTPESLTLLAQRIRSEGVVTLASPPPEVVEDAPLHVVQVISSDGPAELRVVGETIEIRGSDDPRAKLAASVENLASDVAFGGVVARHIDVEHFPGHAFLAEGSAWMTVTLLAAPGQ